MKYKLGEFVFTKDNSSNEYFESQPIGNRKACFDEWMLIKLGATPIDDKPETEFYQCKSYYDNNNQLQNCTCGKCGEKSVITTKEVEEHQKIELPDITATGDLSSETEVTIPMRQWMLDVTNWINSQNKGE